MKRLCVEGGGQTSPRAVKWAAGLRGETAVTGSRSPKEKEDPGKILEHLRRALTAE